MHPLAQRITRFIQEPDSDTFEGVALAVFARQYEANEPYRRLCDAEGLTPQSLTRWQDIPAVPALAFKLFDLTCSPVEQAKRVFYSSGTTGKQASRHYLDGDALQIYARSLARGYKNAVPQTGEIWAVMPSPFDAPHSSLSYMLGALHAVRFAGDSLADFAGDLRETVRENPEQPITVFGTAFGLARMREYSPAEISLPPESIVVETGGFKGRTREIERGEFYGLLQDYFHVSDAQCFSEYGMCEMASQFYAQGADGALYGPHWVRTRLIDPATNTDAAPGQPGVLRHYDLANFNSVLALQTQDWGVVLDDGFSLRGRATDAELRGCSLTAEELWGSE